MDALYKAIVEALAQRGQKERDRREEWNRSLKPTQYLGKNLFQEMGGQPIEGRYLGKRSLIPGQFVPNIGRNPNKPVVPGLPNPVQETIEEEDIAAVAETIVVLSTIVIPEYEFDGTNVLDAFQVNVSLKRKDKVIFEDAVALLTPFSWVPVGNPYRLPNYYAPYTSFSQSNSLDGTYTNGLNGFTQPVQVVASALFERYRWNAGRGFDGTISGSSLIDGSNAVEVVYRSRIANPPTDISRVEFRGSGFGSIVATEKITRSQDITMDLFHSILTSFDILNVWGLSSTLSGSFLPNPELVEQWQYDDNKGWIYWLEIKRGVSTATSYSDQYFFGFQGKLKRLNNKKVYGKRIFIDGSIKYAEGEKYEELVYTESVITPQDFRDNPSSHLLVFN